MARQSPAAAEPPPDLTGFGAFLEQARWLFDRQWQRADAFERKAIALLGFDGVLVGLLVTAAAQLRPSERTGAVEAFACLAAATALVCALFCVQVLRPRVYEGVGVKQLREDWVGALEREIGAVENDRPWVERSFAEQFLHGSPDAPGEGPLASVQSDASERGQWLERATWAMLVSVLLTAGLFLALLWR